MISPDPSKVRAERHIRLSHQGVQRTQFFFSYSGGLIVEGPLPLLAARLPDGREFQIGLTRIGLSSLRPTPQLTFDNITRFFKVDIPTPYPIQVATFPGIGFEQATANGWFGPSQDHPPGSPVPPADTFLVTLHGAESANHGEHIERLLLAPLLNWLRVLTYQWWIGRSIEGANGALHFIAPLAEEGHVVGSPTPVVRFTSASPKMRAVTEAVWIEAARRAWANEIPPADKALEMDANFTLASHEFRSGVILSCCAIEAGRDILLGASKTKIGQLGTSASSLPKHLSVGFENRFGANLASQNPQLYQLLCSFWNARGRAAHGKPVLWATDRGQCPIEQVEFGVFSDGLAGILDWISQIDPQSIEAR